MSKIDDGGTAFPQAQRMFDNDTQSWIVCSIGGMTLRDYFAAAAMQAFVSSYNEGGIAPEEDIAVDSYSIADAMLAARKEAQP